MLPPLSDLLSSSAWTFVEGDPIVFPEPDELENELLADFLIFINELLLLSSILDEAKVGVTFVVLLLSIVVGVPTLPMVFSDSVDSLLNIE